MENWMMVPEQVARLWDGPTRIQTGSKSKPSEHWVCTQSSSGTKHGVDVVRAADAVHAYTVQVAKDSAEALDPDQRKTLLALRSVLNPRNADGTPDPQYTRRAPKALQASTDLFYAIAAASRAKAPDAADTAIAMADLSSSLVHALEMRSQTRDLAAAR